MSAEAIGDPRSSGTRGTTPSKAGPIVLLVLGLLVSLLGSSVLIGGVALAVVNTAQADDGFFTTPDLPFSVPSHAVTSPGMEVAGDLWIPPTVPFDIATFQLEAAPAGDAGEVFVGLAERADVEGYLAGVHHSEVRDMHSRPFSVDYRDVDGTRTPEAPQTQTFWAESASGAGPQRIQWQPRAGDWVIVVMNADGSRGVDVDMVAGVHTDLLWPVALGLLIGGGILVILGLVMVILGAVGLGRNGAKPPAAPQYSAPM